eukprot:CAMPEP_0183599038 /NCGR_PEP_ID=MMETSP0371-20130417/179229_1 /TAXON_ID=268820 /ORGANISM="Peridinium aciculiferum, Strain PAER-2" /LENGTH=731 /DNA_ID=CAMNT_0025811101 /DNA_START=64 /DNA_END=2259 /DNA_ORIENTATION=-
MVSLRVLIVACLAVSTSAVGLRGRTALSMNPIRRVVTMMQGMQKKVEEEGKRDQGLYDKFMCYCTTGAKDLAASVQAAETKMPAVISALEEARAQKTQLEADLVQHKQDRVDAEDAVKAAMALREKEAAIFAKASADYQTNIAATGKAIDLISKGAGGSFLQSNSAAVVRTLTINMDLSSVDRDMMSSFLSEGQGEGYAPQSGQITGILKQMKDTMEADLADVTAAEEAAKASCAELVAAKEKEIAANSKAIEDKTKRLGETGVKIEELKEDLEDTSGSYEEDKKFLADLDKNCATKTTEYEVVKKTRAEETLAIAETIKILNDDDALDLFKKALPSPSLLQVAHRGKEVRRLAMKALRGSPDNRLDFISLVLRGKKVSFDKVLAMVDEMVTLLGQEQVDDDEKKAYCQEKMDAAEDKKKVLDLDISDLEKAIEETKAFIETVTVEIAALAAGIKALDKSVIQATAFIETVTVEIAALAAGIKALDKSVIQATDQRKAENEEYKSTMAENTAAKELLGVAKNRLNKFYNPKLYVAAVKRELSEEDRIAVNMGGTPPPTEAPGGIAGTGVAVFVQVKAHTQRADDTEAPPPPPEAVGAYMKKGEQSTGVLAMVDMLVADLDKEMQEMEVEEKDAQADYEKYVQNSADKRAQDAKSIEEKESAKADAEATLGKAELDKKSKVAESYATAMILRDLHLECDWLLSNFDMRKDARVGEIDSLKKAKAILSGADFA